MDTQRQLSPSQSRRRNPRRRRRRRRCPSARRSHRSAASVSPAAPAPSHTQNRRRAGQNSSPFVLPPLPQTVDSASVHDTYCTRTHDGATRGTCVERRVCRIGGGGSTCCSWICCCCDFFGAFLFCFCSSERTPHAHEHSEKEHIVPRIHRQAHISRSSQPVSCACGEGQLGTFGMEASTYLWSFHSVLLSKVSMSMVTSSSESTSSRFTYPTTMTTILAHHPKPLLSHIAYAMCSST